MLNYTCALALFMLNPNLWCRLLRECNKKFYFNLGVQERDGAGQPSLVMVKAGSNEVVDSRNGHST